MGTPESYASIEIAGQIASQEALDKLVGAIVYDNLGDEDGARRAVLDAVTVGGRLEMSSSFARYGHFETLEQACEDCGLWFSRNTNTDYQIDGHDATYNPDTKQLHEAHDCGNGHFMLLSEARKVLDKGGPEALAARVLELETESDLAVGKGMPDQLTMPPALLSACEAAAATLSGGVL